MEHLALYSKNCKTCSYLDPDEVQAFEACHFSKGNKECPAQDIQFAVVGEAKRMASLIKQARAKGDIKKEVRILQAVSKRSPAFQHKFREWS